jgi:hypothetical protein
MGWRLRRWSPVGCQPQRTRGALHAGAQLQARHQQRDSHGPLISGHRGDLHPVAAVVQVGGGQALDVVERHAGGDNWIVGLTG